MEWRIARREERNREEEKKEEFLLSFPLPYRYNYLTWDAPKQCCLSDTWLRVGGMGEHKFSYDCLIQYQSTRSYKLHSRGPKPSEILCFYDIYRLLEESKGRDKFCENNFDFMSWKSMIDPTYLITKKWKKNVGKRIMICTWYYWFEKIYDSP